MAKLQKVDNVPNLSYSINKFKKKDYYARFNTLEDGKPKQNTKKLGTTSLTEAKKILDFVLKGKTVPEAKQILSKKNLKKSNEELTLNWLQETYLSVAKGWLSKKEHTNKEYRYNARIRPFIGSIPYKKLKFIDCQNLINTLDDMNSKGEIACSRKTQDNIKADLSALFTFAIQNEYITTSNPARYVRIKPYDNKININLSNDEIKSLYEIIRDMPIDTLENRKKRMFFILCIHGRRKGEVLSLSWSDVNLFDREYQIRLENAKAKKRQLHSMTDWLYEEFLNFRSQTPIHELDGYVFLNPRTNKPYVEFNKTFKTIKKNAGITTPLRLHDLRHIIGTVAARKCNRNISDIGEALAHNSIQTTQIYIDDSSQNSKSVVDDVLKEVGFIENNETKKKGTNELLEEVIELLKQKI